jgi:hypothetical protein
MAKPRYFILKLLNIMLFLWETHVFYVMVFEMHFFGMLYDVDIFLLII